MKLIISAQRASNKTTENLNVKFSLHFEDKDELLDTPFIFITQNILYKEYRENYKTVTSQADLAAKRIPMALHSKHDSITILEVPYEDQEGLEKVVTARIKEFINPFIQKPLPKGKEITLT